MQLLRTASHSDDEASGDSAADDSADGHGSDDSADGDHAARDARRALVGAGRSVRITFEWDGLRQSGVLSLSDVRSMTELLEAIVIVGEGLLRIPVGAAQAQIYYVSRADGRKHKLLLHQTTWSELLRDCSSLYVQKMATQRPVPTRGARL